MYKSDSKAQGAENLDAHAASIPFSQLQRLTGVRENDFRVSSASIGSTLSVSSVFSTVAERKAEQGQISARQSKQRIGC